MSGGDLSVRAMGSLRRWPAPGLAYRQAASCGAQGQVAVSGPEKHPPQLFPSSAA